MKVCMISTTHDLYDGRIYNKEALSLKRNGFDVICIVISNEDQAGETTDGIKYIKIKPVPHFNRNVFMDDVLAYENFTYEQHSKETYQKIFEIAAATESDFYHLHDLYLNRIGKKLKELPHRPKVIYDVHESYPDIVRDYSKQDGVGYLNKILYSYYLDAWEITQSRHYDFIINVEESINNRFKKKVGANKTDIIYNYPIIDFSRLENGDNQDKEYDLIYCGAIHRLRGAMEILKVVNEGKKFKSDLKMLFVGPVDAGLELEMKNYIKSNHLEDNVIFKGKIPFNEVSYYYRKSKIGLVLLHPIQKYLRAIPVKMFEYMANGLPIIGSDLPHIREVVNQSSCGRIVDLGDPKAIWQEIANILNNPEIYKECSLNGKGAIKNTYNWDEMAEKLTLIYDRLIAEGAK